MRLFEIVVFTVLFSIMGYLFYKEGVAAGKKESLPPPICQVDIYAPEPAGGALLLSIYGIVLNDAVAFNHSDYDLRVSIECE